MCKLPVSKLKRKICVYVRRGMFWRGAAQRIGKASRAIKFDGGPNEVSKLDRKRFAQVRNLQRRLSFTTTKHPNTQTPTCQSNVNASTPGVTVHSECSYILHDLLNSHLNESDTTPVNIAAPDVKQTPIPHTDVKLLHIPPTTRRSGSPPHQKS